MSHSHQCNCTGPIEWSVVLSETPEAIWTYLDSDELRETYWAPHCKSVKRGFQLRFADGTSTLVEVIEARRPEVMRLWYFESSVTIELRPLTRGCIVRVIDDGPDGPDWRERYAGWVNWLLILKARVEHSVDLRNGHAGRGWGARFADP